MDNKEQRPKVAVGAMIFRDGKVLIGKRRKTASHGAFEYCFPGGHVEANESFKEAILRETKEEAGIEINNLKFLCVVNVDKFKNYQVVLIGLTADWKSKEAKSFPEERIGEWGWYDLDNLPSSLFYPTECMVKSYKTGRNYFDIEK